MVTEEYVNQVITASGHTRETYEGPFPFPENTQTIANDAFRECIALKELTLPNTVKYIGHSAFSACQSLKAIVMPNSVMDTGIELFAWCIDLELITLSKNLKQIRFAMFAQCQSLKAIVIPKNVKRIAQRAFEYCESLKAINFLGNVEIFQNFAFRTTSVEFIVAPKSLFFSKIDYYNNWNRFIGQKEFAHVFEKSLKLAVLNNEDAGNSEVILFNSKPPSFLPSTISKTGIAKALTVRSFVYPPINAWQQWLNLSRKLFPSLPDELRLIIIGFINGKSTAEFNAILKTFDVSRAIAPAGALYDHTVP